MSAACLYCLFRARIVFRPDFSDANIVKSVLRIFIVFRNTLVVVVVDKSNISIQ